MTEDLISSKDMITLLLKNNKELCSDFFEKNILKEEIRNKLLEIANLYIKNIKPFFAAFEVEDICFCGGLASYRYCDFTDIDISIILKNENFEPDNKKIKNILRDINISHSNLMKNVRILGRSVDIGLVNFNNFGDGVYSLKKNEWIIPSQYRTYDFRLNEFINKYADYVQEINQKVIALKKYNNALLRPESCRALEKILEEVRNKAILERDNHVQKEYCIEYNLYRCLKKMGKYTELKNYIRDSYGYIINKLEEKYE